MVPLSDETTHREGFMIFGGANLSCYCRSKIYTFTLMNKKREVQASPTKNASTVDKQNLKYELNI